MGRRWMGGPIEAAKRWKLQNKDAAKLHRRNDFLKKREFVNREKSRPCSDCGVQYSTWVMQFDHRDPALKLFDLSDFGSIGMEKIMAEIAKCDAVCANCHAERTHKNQHHLAVNTGYLSHS